MPGPLCLGLHVTKCAGTSLITALRSRLSDDEYYFCSSYHENWLTGRIGFGDMVARERLRIVFGHYCHENLLSVFADRPLFLFTGLREPVACAISRYRHLNVVRAEARREPLSAEAFLEGNVNPMCGEILRCFPSLADQRGPLWQKARAALSLFDFIYTTERFDLDVAVLFDVLEIVGGRVAPENVSDRRALPDETTRYVMAECATIRASDREFLGEDMRLWEAMQPFLSRAWLRVALAGIHSAADCRHGRWRWMRSLNANGISSCMNSWRSDGCRNCGFPLNRGSPRPANSSRASRPMPGRPSVM
jgi:hypothetical protein